MKIFSKMVDGGRVRWYFCGVKILSYTSSSARVLDFGENNDLVNIPEACSVCIYGSNNCVRFMGVGAFVGAVYIGTADCPVCNCLIEIAEGVTSNGIMIRVMENGTVVRIGRGSMISSEVQIWASDTHAMVSADGALLNRGKSVEIGENVWICNDVTVLKNTTIPSGCVIGTRAVVSGKWVEENVVLAGNPARVCKRDVHWTRQRPQHYL